MLNASAVFDSADLTRCVMIVVLFDVVTNEFEDQFHELQKAKGHADEIVAASVTEN